MNKKIVGGTLVALMALLAVNEGTKTTAYKDMGGKWTICTGSTAGVTAGQVATMDECRQRLADDIAANCPDIDRLPFDVPSGVVLAHCDLSFNIGRTKYLSSTAWKRLRAGDVAGSCGPILWWKYANDAQGKRVDCFDDANAKVCGGIKKRRHDEYRLCVEGA